MYQNQSQFKIKTLFQKYTILDKTLLYRIYHSDVYPIIQEL